MCWSGKPAHLKSLVDMNTHVSAGRDSLFPHNIRLATTMNTALALVLCRWMPCASEKARRVLTEMCGAVRPPDAGGGAPAPARFVVRFESPAGVVMATSVDELTPSSTLANLRDAYPAARLRRLEGKEADDWKTLIASDGAYARTDVFGFCQGPRVLVGENRPLDQFGFVPGVNVVEVHVAEVAAAYASEQLNPTPDTHSERLMALSTQAAVRAFAVRRGSNFGPIPSPYCADREVIGLAVSRRGYDLEWASEKLRADREIVTIAVSDSGLAFQHASEELRADRGIAMAAVSKCGFALEYASEELRADRGIVMAAVSNDGLALEHASEELRADYDIVMAAVTKFGSVLKYASDTMRADRKIVLAAVLQNGFALDDVSKELRADRDVVATAAYTCPIAVRLCASEDMLADPQVLRAIRKSLHERASKCVPPCNKELEGMQSDDVRKEIDFVEVAENRFSMAKTQYRADYDFVLAATNRLEHRPGHEIDEMLQYVKKRLRMRVLQDLGY